MTILLSVVGYFLIVTPFVFLLGAYLRTRSREIAPKGTLNFHFKHPNTSGSKLSVRVISKSKSPEHGG